MSFIPGTQVRLTSGGPVMTVDHIETPGNEVNVICHYFVGNNIVRESCTASTLEVIDNFSQSTKPKVGDILRLPSGSPEMTVNKIVTPGKAEIAEVIWFSGTTIQMQKINVYALIVVTRPAIRHIDAGDKVKLPSGSPEMTVNFFETPGNERNAVCVFFIKEEVITHRISSGALIAIEANRTLSDVGDKVSLVSGGPVATLEKITTPDSLQIAHIIWYSDERFRREEFHRHALRRIEKKTGPKVEVGNVVVLPSGGPKMTVQKIETPGNERNAVLHWFQGANHRSITINSYALEKVT